MTDATTVGSRCTELGIDLVRLLFVTQSGAVHAPAVEAGKVDDVVDSGTTVSELVQMYNAVGLRDKEGRIDTVGEVRLRPDPETFRALPYAERTGGMLCDVETLAGEPWAVDGRSALRALIDDLRADDLAPRVAFESEFHFYRRGDGGDEPVEDVRGAYLAESTRGTHAATLGVVDALAAQDVTVEKCHPEYAPGKHEVVTGHRPGVRAADEHVLLRETVDSVAREHDLRATFLPRPFENATNGCHLHVSLWGDDNAFHDPERDDLSETGRQFVAGVLEHAPALTALTAPTANSYARLRPQNGAAGFVCWGHENREALLRVPARAGSDDGGSLRLEFRGADNAVNPYVALLGLLGAGYDGIQRDLEPPRPLSVDPGNLTDAERRDADVERLPRTLGDALDALEADDRMRELLGEPLFRTYLEVKRSHWRQFALDSARSWQLDHLRGVY